MNRHILVLLLIVILLSGCRSNKVAQVGKYEISRDDIAAYKRSRKFNNPNDSIMDGNALFELIGYYTYRTIIDRYEIDINPKSIVTDKYMKDYDKLINSIPSDMSDSALYEKYIITPHICSAVTADYFMYDSLNFQREQYEYAYYIYDNWNAQNTDSFINEYTEYFIIGPHKSHALHKIAETANRQTFNISENHIYYYVTRIQSDTTKGFRIIKKPFLGKVLHVAESIDIKFFDEALMRSVHYITLDSPWHNIIFNE